MGYSFDTATSVETPNYSTMSRLSSAVTKHHMLSASKAAKEARSGKDMGKKGKNFSRITAKASKKYGSTAAGERVAGAVFNHLRKTGKL